MKGDDGIDVGYAREYEKHAGNDEEHPAELDPSVQIDDRRENDAERDGQDNRDAYFEPEIEDGSQDDGYGQRRQIAGAGP